VEAHMLNTPIKQYGELKSYDPVLEQEYATRTEIHFALRISYWRMNMAVREGRLALHLMDNKIKVRVQDIIDLFIAQ
jgi:hypothetical protein